MADYKMGVVETRFADIIWANAPLSSGELVKRCEAELGWKKSTAYTVLKKLCEKGIFVNDGGRVQVLIGKEEYAGRCSEHFVEETFAGSLSAFIAAFTARKVPAAEEVREIRRLIDAFGKGEP